LTVEINATNGAVDETFAVAGGLPQTIELETGPFLRVTGTQIDLDVLGQSLRGDFVITRSTDAAGAPVLRIVAENVSLRLGGTPAAPILTATQTENTPAEILITSAGVAANVSVDIALSVPGVEIGGTIA